MKKHIQIGFKKDLFLKYKIQVEYNFNICEGGGSAEKTKLGEAGEALAGGRQVSLVQAEAGKNCYTSFMSWHLYWSKKHKIAWCKVFSFQSYFFEFILRLQVPKAGSSSWVANFLKLAGVDASTSSTKSLNGMNHKAMRKHYPTPRIEVPSQHSTCSKDIPAIANSSLLFTVVR